jgi:PhnB protein
MSMQVQTTLNFKGHTEEAIDFNCRALGAKIVFLMRFGENPDKSMMRPGTEDKIFHATFRIGSTEFMASDVGCYESQTGVFEGFRWPSEYRRQRKQSIFSRHLAMVERCRFH